MISFRSGKGLPVNKGLNVLRRQLVEPGIFGILGLRSSVTGVELRGFCSASSGFVLRLARYAIAMSSMSASGITMMRIEVVT